MRITALLLTLLVPSVALAQQTGSLQYRDPASIRHLPPVVRADLQDRNCLVPAVNDTMVSALQGEFQHDGQKDWAILCVNGREGKILLFLDNDGNASDSFPSRNDRYLAMAPPEYIIQRLRRYSEDTTLVHKSDSLKAAIRHNGIVESDTVGRSTIHYWQNGKWQIYAGSDD